jgi:hypothetical protein
MAKHMAKEMAGFFDPGPAEPAEVINQPGQWDAMISYTQHNAVSETLAHALHGEFTMRGLAVWLDVKMAKRDEAAMEEGVKSSRCVVAIVSGAPGGQSDDTAYFQREFCLKELRWAVQAKVFIQPIVAAEDKGMITEFFAAIPNDMQHLKGVNWEHIDRKDADYFQLGVTKIIRAAGLDMEPEPELEPEPEAELKMADAVAQGWSVAEVADWVRSLAPQLGAGLAGEVAGKVTAEEVDGRTLLEYERPDLKADLGLTAGAFAKLWRAVEALRGAPPAAGSPHTARQVIATAIVDGLAAGSELEAELTEPEPEVAEVAEVASRGIAQMACYDAAEFRNPDGVRPEGIFSYASASDDGKGIQHMWAVGNALRLHGITTYCGLMVRTDNWQVKWFGKLSTAKFAIIMLSDAYWKSDPCLEEVTTILQEGIKVYIVRVDDSCHTCTRGNFLGGSDDQVDQAGFIKLKLDMNCLPPPHEPLFQDNFEANAAELVQQIWLSFPPAALRQHMGLAAAPAPAAAACRAELAEIVIRTDQTRPYPAYRPGPPWSG